MEVSDRITADEEFELLDADLGDEVASCPCCGARPELWQQRSIAGTFNKAVSCSVGHGLADDEDEAGCLLFMPPGDFYQATRREAIAHWNRYATTLASRREAAR